MHILEAIITHYCFPVVYSNPESCTKKKFIYTESAWIRLPHTLVEQATDSSMATKVASYVSTISTNLGGQAVTTSRCDVYLNNKAIQSLDIPTGLLIECIDPRRSTCSMGENAEATVRVVVREYKHLPQLLLAHLLLLRPMDLLGISRLLR